MSSSTARDETGQETERGARSPEEVEGRVKLTVDGEPDGRLLLDGSGGVDLHVRRLLVPGLRHGGCGGCVPAAVGELRASDAFATKGDAETAWVTNSPTWAGGWGLGGESPARDGVFPSARPSRGCFCWGPVRL
jgi:hypothetical protein